MRAALVLGVLLGASACRPRVLYPDVGVATPTEPVVQLRRSDVIHPIGEHYYFVHFDPDGDATWHRTDLFANPREGRRVRRDVYPPDSAFQTRLMRPVRIAREYRGARARRLLGVIETSPETYPRQERYVLTGPNSNSYALWVLRRARVGHDFSARAVGRRVPSRIGLSDSRTGVALHTPVLGIELGLADGIELDLGPMTWGIDFAPPAIRTPFGRIGFPQPSLRVGDSGPTRRARLRAAEAEYLEHLPDSLEQHFREVRGDDRWEDHVRNMGLHILEVRDRGGVWPTPDDGAETPAPTAPSREGGTDAPAEVPSDVDVGP